MFARYLAAWLLLAMVAVGNGVLRQASYGRVLPELLAHQVSTGLGIALIGGLVWLFVRAWPIPSRGTAWAIGLCWLAMTVAFEFGFGHFVAGHPWSRLFADYNLLAGRLWSLFLIWILLAPVLFQRLDRRG